MADIDTSVYAPHPQPNPLDAITKLGPALDSLGGIAVGQATQQAIGPDGQIDQNMLAQILKQSVAGSKQAIPTLDALQKLKSSGFAADQAGLETFQKRMAITHHLFSGLASKEAPTIDDVHDIAAKALDPALEAHKYGITMPVIMNALKQFRGPNGQPLSPQQIKQKALEIQTQAATTSEILDAHHPRQEIIDRGGSYEFVPGGSKVNPALGTTVPKNLPPGTLQYPPEGGAPTYRGEQPSAPAATGPGGQPAIPYLPSLTPNRVRTERYTRPPEAPTAAGNPPGFQEAASGIGATSAAQAARLTEANDSSTARKALLGNLDDMISKFKPGLGSDWELIAKNFANRNIPMPRSWQEDGGISSLKSVASQEEFNKLATQLAQQQFATIGGTGTDAKFGSAMSTSPNELLSKMGNKNIIRLLKGNEDAIQAKNMAWQEWLEKGSPERPGAKGPQTYAQFSADFNSHFDPRTFQFKYMSVPERQDYLDKMDTDEEKLRMLHDITYARKRGWIKFDQPAK